MDDSGTRTPQRIEFIGDGNAVIRFTDDAEMLLPAGDVADFLRKEFANGPAAEHEYPDRYKPGTHWATDAAWEILDRIKPGVIPMDVRSFLAGMIAGRLMTEREQHHIRND